MLNIFWKSISGPMRDTVSARTGSGQKGFSLIELAIVLVVVALLIGGLLVPLSMQIEQQRIRDTQKTLEEIKEALVGFAIANGRLPRPAFRPAMAQRMRPTA